MNKIKMEKCVYLLVGQRGAGKSYYAKRLLENKSGLYLVSRDKILERKFCSNDRNPYQFLNRVLRFVLLQSCPVSKIILDYWTGDSVDRAALIKKLREYGATRIIALYFVTPRKVVNSWFWFKPGIAKIEEIRTRKGENLVYFPVDTPSRDYGMFHKYAKDIDSDGFDQVIRIDPRKPIISI